MAHVYPGNPANVTAHAGVSVTNPDDGDALTAASNNAAIESMATLTDVAAFLQAHALLRDQANDNLSGKVTVTGAGEIEVQGILQLSSGLLELMNGSIAQFHTSIDCDANFVLNDTPSGDTAQFMQATFPGTWFSSRGFTVSAAAVPGNDDGGFLFDADRELSQIIPACEFTGTFNAPGGLFDGRFAPDDGSTSTFGGQWYARSTTGEDYTVVHRQRIPTGATPDLLFIGLNNNGAVNVDFELSAYVLEFNPAPTLNDLWIPTQILAPVTVTITPGVSGWSGPHALTAFPVLNNRTLIIVVTPIGVNAANASFQGCALRYDYFKLTPEI